ncbi:uncharacterized protein LTR77_002308 [Saxophila tyrrhenica]|uniref:Sterigmatocystin biosynthesis monooxygenase stcW n=1 Tax=Saxophila tyrrhenica TaxID=1690608 RepID=A0AAV9PIJ5_9PEZI|nr:hypothetical protein LTR77_002308 [Saxophila tyrrhenica]
MPQLEETQPYRVKNQYHSQGRTIRVINVGAGAAGLLMAYKMKKLFSDYELICYEKNPSVAGTWYENRYPGCACDVPAHAYTFSFEPNPEWDCFFAYAPQIKRYFEGFAEKYDLNKYIKLNSKVTSATWDEAKGIYNLNINSEGQELEDWCHVLVNGTGFLNDWKWPKIPGLHDFQGKLLHSANWDQDVDYDGKTVAVIGTGSSAIQIVPQVQKKASHLTAFMRSVTWISPVVGEAEIEAEKEKHTSQSEREPQDEKKLMKQYWYTEEDKQRFRDDPEHLLQYRKKLESAVNSMFDMFISNSDVSKGANDMMRAEMNRRIGPGHEELKNRLIPSWSPGCRRITPGDGYLEALVKPNVTTVHEEIEKIVPEGLLDGSGKLHKVDIIACATGFNIAFAPPFEVYGTNGANMRQEFDPEPQVYLAMSVPKFPNYFVVNGVRGNWANGTSLPGHEACVEYILKCVKKIQNENIRALEVKQEPITQLYEHIDAWHQGSDEQGEHPGSVWNEDCKSWYKNNIRGGKLWIWGGSALHFMKTIKEVKWEHYDHRYNGNMWSFLGNGRVKAEMLKDTSRLAPYMRNSDVPWDIE